MTSSTRCGSVTSNFYMAVRGSHKSVRQMEPWEIFRNGRPGDVRVTALSILSLSCPRLLCIRHFSLVFLLPSAQAMKVTHKAPGSGLIAMFRYNSKRRLRAVSGLGDILHDSTSQGSSNDNLISTKQTNELCRRSEKSSLALWSRGNLDREDNERTIIGSGEVTETPNCLGK